MDRIRQHRTRCSALGARYSVLLIACLAFAGCTTSGLFSKLSHKGKFPKATANNPAVRCLCLWEPADGTGVDEKPARGVAGQIFFFTRNDVSSVEIDGDVCIYLFDDQGSAEEQTHPLHQFNFVAGSWKAHLTSTQFGPAYQLFVPYSRKGHHQAELALRVRLTPPNGPPVFSDIAKVVLTGYDSSKVKHNAGASESEARNADDNVSQDGITPKQIEQTLLKVLAENHGQATETEPHGRRSREPLGSSKFAGAETADPSVRRHSRRASEPVNSENMGEVVSENEE